MYDMLHDWVISMGSYECIQDKNAGKVCHNNQLREGGGQSWGKGGGSQSWPYVPLNLS